MNERERMRAALRGDGDIREDDQLRVHAIGIRDDGTEVSLGWVSGSLAYSNPGLANAALERIRFPPR